MQDPPTDDIIKDVCVKMGVSPVALTPAQVDAFASLVKSELAGIFPLRKQKPLLPSCDH